MATTRYWLGSASAVAQVTDVTVGGTLSGETFAITVGGVTIATTAAVSDDKSLTAKALLAQWNASEHPYAAYVTCTDLTSTVAGKIRFTSDVAGMPFALTLNTPGGSATFGQTAITANSGPNDWGTASNWSGTTVPEAGDTAIFADSAVPVCWGLNQSSIALAALKIMKTYTGKIGLARTTFATAADAATGSTDAIEYRDCYLQIGATTASIGEQDGPGAASGSGRININFGSSAVTVTVHATASSATETGLPAVRLLTNSASAVIYVRSASGGVGVAVGAPGETSTAGTISISDTGTSSRVFTGAGVTLTTWEQYGGANQLKTASAVTTCTVRGGTLLADVGGITTLNQYAGTVTSNAAITTANLYGGTLSGAGSTAARTWGTVAMHVGSILSANSSVTVTTLTRPTGVFSLTAS